MANTSKANRLADELGVVRKFLQRNNLDSLVALLMGACDRPVGAKVSQGAVEVPEDGAYPIAFTQIEWDSDAFFQPASPTRLTVPGGLAGRYLIQVATRWLDHRQVFGDEPLPDSFYYAFISLNGSVHPAGNDARSTANNIEGGGTGTTQHFTYETDLNEGDFVELKVWQGFGSPVHCHAFFQLRRVGTPV